jgi:hypothetical protein
MHNDGNVMVFGAIWCPKAKSDEIYKRIKDLKLKHGLKPNHVKIKAFHKPRFELKWNKVSKTKLAFYRDIVDFFFDDDDLHFRCLVVPDKSALDHAAFNQTHDQFYYKMYFKMLKAILSPGHAHYVYIDIKDTRSNEKVEKLAEVLRNSAYDFSSQIVKRIQQVHSQEVELIQLADFFTGAIGYVQRGLKESKAKLELIERIKQRSRYSLTRSTLSRELKFNIFIWGHTKIGGGNE